MKNILRYTFALAITLGAGSIGSVMTTPAIPQWYVWLEKSTLTPPSWVFAPVWTLLYILMGIALARVWGMRKSIARRDWLVIFWLQLFLNVVWSLLFFGLRSPDYAVVDITMLWASILALVYESSRFDRVSMYLLLPYLAWVSFASYLNAFIWLAN